MQHHYPIILIPKAIHDIKQITIPLLKAPVKPIEPQKLESSNLGWYLFLLAILIAPEIPFIGILSILIAIISLWHNNNIKKEYLQKKQIFATALQEYEVKNNSYITAQKEVSTKRNDTTELKKFQKNELLKLLAATTTAELTLENLNGKSEKDFLRVLNIYFRGCIFTNRGIEVFNNSRAYVPDFIFIHKRSNLHIDIEIDEPYVAGTGQPIHYCEYRNSIYYCIDNSRNIYFMDKGWCIIRFAEEQVIKYPIECCKVIAKVIQDIIEDSTYINKFDIEKELPTVKHWTENEAIAMCKNDFRNQYHGDFKSVKKLNT